MPDHELDDYMCRLLRQLTRHKGVEHLHRIIVLARVRSIARVATATRGRSKLPQQRHCLIVVELLGLDALIASIKCLLILAVLLDVRLARQVLENFDHVSRGWRSPCRLATTDNIPCHARGEIDPRSRSRLRHRRRLRQLHLPTRGRGLSHPRRPLGSSPLVATDELVERCRTRRDHVHEPRELPPFATDSRDCRTHRCHLTSHLRRLRVLPFTQPLPLGFRDRIARRRSGRQRIENFRRLTIALHDSNHWRRRLLRPDPSARACNHVT